MTQPQPSPLLGPRFQQALALAFELHRTQTRKGTHIPYISHPMAVAGLVLEHGGSEDQAIAALLHDAAEDQGGEVTLARIEEDFGAAVASLVRALSDSIAEEGQEGAPKEDWKVRKTRYLAHLAEAPAPVRLISAADKLHNLRTLLSDLREHGPAIWERFNAPPECQRWYYQRLHEVLASQDRTRIVDELADALLDLEQAMLPGGLAKAIAIAARVHLHQQDKAGAPYVLHPLRLMARAQGDEAKVAAMLHDVVEDGDGWNLERLRREGFSEAVVAAVGALSRSEGESYEEFIERVSKDPLAREVKLLDLEDNLDVTRLGELSDRDLARVRKYHVSWKRLRS